MSFSDRLLPEHVTNPMNGNSQNEPKANARKSDTATLPTTCVHCAKKENV